MKRIAFTGALLVIAAAGVIVLSGASSGASAEANPETLLLHQVDAQELRHALEALPMEFREVIILRELEDCSYKEIAAITAIPLGTVMSRLARARQRLQHWLVSQAEGGLP